MKRTSTILALAAGALALASCCNSSSSGPSVCDKAPECQSTECSAGVQKKDAEFTTEFLTPTRIVLSSGDVVGAENLLKPFRGQVVVGEREFANFRSSKEQKSSILLDFGKEIQGGLQIVRAQSGGKKTARFRVCFGESVSEALSDVNEPGSTATNDHSARDIEVELPWLGSHEVGETGFRFARIDLLDEDVDIHLVAVRAVSRYRDIPYLGSFACSDERLDQIWKAGAYTVHLNMQDYLWDGIKRDRLVWIGDMDPEVLTVNTVFGNHPVVQKSLDHVKSCTDPKVWMNGICSYSMWWIIIHHHLYEFYGDLDYLKAQHSYIKEMLRNIIANIDGDKEAFKSGRFVDWPSSGNLEAIHACLQALSVRTLEAGADIAEWVGDSELGQECEAVATKLREYVPATNGSKQAAALLSIQGMLDPAEAAAQIEKDGAVGFTSFYGYYMLEALAKAGHYSEAMKLISDYWGAMLDLGATTFWEDFDYVKGLTAARIDEVVPEGEDDIHADGGAHCYVGLRHSFCHGWASGPTTWLSRHVLGVQPLEPGFKKVKVEPHLGDLEWAEGTFPTPYGEISVSHRKGPDGKVVSKVSAPKGVKIVK